MMVAVAALLLSLAACGPQQQESEFVISTDPELRERAGELLPDLASRAGMALVRPVRIQRKSREELVAYLRHKLDEEFPPEEAERLTGAYRLLGLVPGEFELRDVLLSVYTEQVAGFYEPDSTALFVMDDMPVELLEPVLIHELVHAVQDQTANLDSLTARVRGNDRQIAAQSAIEGHATIVMLEYMAEQARGEPVDFSELPDFSEAIRPALEGMRAQYPALASAPAIIREGLLFPYLEGVSFVGDLWTAVGDRPPPFGPYLPQSTEQVLDPDRARGEGVDEPTEIRLEVSGPGEFLYENSLGQMELQVLLEEHLGTEGRALAEGWDGDRFVLMEAETGERGLAWMSVWDDLAARDRFINGFEAVLATLPAEASLEARDMTGRPGALLRVGLSKDFNISAVDGAPSTGGAPFLGQAPEKGTN